MSVGSDIAEDFLIEAGELAEKLGEQLVALEHSPGDAELLNAVFRGFHTIKGGAGFLDLAPMVELCHATEEAFNVLRSGQRGLDAVLFDAAQAALDETNGMLAALRAGQPLPHAPAALIETLASVSASSHPPVAAAAVAAAPKSDEISDDEFEALLDSLGAGGGVPPEIAPDPKPAPPPASKRVAPVDYAAQKRGDAPAVESTVRVDTRRLDAIMNLVGELVLARNRLKTLKRGKRDEELERAVGALDLATARLQSAVMKTRMQPVGRVFSRFPKLARDVARTLAKDVDLVVEGAETELDKTLVESLADPLVHLVRNAIDHGIEMPEVREKAGKPRSGKVVLSARQEGDHIAISVRDDGGGIDPEVLRSKARDKGLITVEAASRLSPEECLQLVFLPGFSTKSAVTEISGRGVGMDVVQSKIVELNGRVTIQSTRGQGTTFLIRVPLTLAILPALLVCVGNQPYALPLARVNEVFHFRSDELRYVDGREVLDQRESTLPLAFLRRWLGLGQEIPADSCVVILGVGEGRLGLVVDQVRGREEVVIKPLPKLVRGLAGFAGATLTGDGRLAPILDVDGLARTVGG